MSAWTGSIAPAAPPHGLDEGLHPLAGFLPASALDLMGGRNVSSGNLGVGSRVQSPGVLPERWPWE